MTAARPGRRWLRLVLGWTFVVLGFAGLVLPVLQGVLFLAIGLGLLSRDVPWARRLLERLRARHPEWAATLDRAAVRVRRLGDRLNRRGST